MPSQEHVVILEQGVEAWNKWRADHPGIVPKLGDYDFRNLDLSGINLRSADLTYTTFSGCNLSQADLRWARLYSSDLRGATLAGAALKDAELNAVFFCTDLSGIALHGVDLRLLLNIQEINLRGADLSGSILRGAPLSERDLTETNLSGADLVGANLSKACLEKAVLVGTNLFGANLREANLRDAIMTGANFSGVGIAGLSYRKGVLNSVTLRGGAGEDIFPISSLGAASTGPIAHLLLSGSLEGADLKGTQLNQANFDGLSLGGINFSGAILKEASFVGADLLDASFRQTDMSGADLSATLMIGTNFEQARLTGCRVHGVSAWGLKLEGAEQSNLVITSDNEPVITIDNIEVAQFIYLLLNNERIRNVIDTITSKMVLILGRFDSTRKPVLDAIRVELRKRNYIPVLFDWDKPAHRDLTETVSTLAHMSRFIIADITEPRSIPQELQRIVPSLPSVPIQPLLQSLSHEYGMFEHFRHYPWVLEVCRYDDVAGLLEVLDQRVIKPAENKARLLEDSKGRR